MTFVPEGLEEPVPPGTPSTPHHRPSGMALIRSRVRGHRASRATVGAEEVPA